MKKILIVYTTAGAGHKKAALAIKEALEELAPKDTEVSVINTLDFSSPFFRWVYLKGYLVIINKFPKFWGNAYYLTNNVFFDRVISGLRRWSNWINSKKLREHLVASRPDVIVSTHFFPAEVVSDLKRKNMLQSKLVTVVTDYRLHLWWLSDQVDVYVVGGEQAKEDLLRHGTVSARIKVLGIPVGPAFVKPLDRKNIRDRIGLLDNTPVLLVIGGGLGLGPFEDIIKIIDSVSAPLQILAVCGDNERLVKELEGLKPSLKHEIRIFGFVNNVHELMEISGLLLSKSGGVTTAESLAKELPMIVIDPIIGQETRNRDFLTSQGASPKVNGLSELKGVLENLVGDPGKMQKMKDSIEKLKKPMACYDVAKMAMEMASR